MLRDNAVGFPLEFKPVPLILAYDILDWANVKIPIDHVVVVDKLFQFTPLYVPSIAKVIGVGDVLATALCITINAPLPMLLLVVVVPLYISLSIYVDPFIYIFPPTNKSLAIPAPPSTFSAPVVLDVD